VKISPTEDRKLILAMDSATDQDGRGASSYISGGSVQDSHSAYRFLFTVVTTGALIAIIFGALASSQINLCGAVDTQERLVVRVLVLTMLNDEAAPWLARESLPILVPVAGAYAPLHCAANGLCVATIGEGKSNAATSVSAILGDWRLDLNRSYFITVGIAGTPPSVGTLGFAAWAQWLIDWDLGHHLLPSSAPQVPHGYLPGEDVGTSVYRLNSALVNNAYQLTKKMRLLDNEEAVAARHRYPGQADRKPYVAVCDTVTGDDYWAGQELSQAAQYIADLRTRGQAHYCTTQQEDNATATALARRGLLDRYLSLRTASDFDAPSSGQNVADLLKTFPGYQVAIENEYLVGSTVAHFLLVRRNLPPAEPSGC
jgi:purine nucleoside permease